MMLTRQRRKGLDVRLRPFAIMFAAETRSRMVKKQKSDVTRILLAKLDDLQEKLGASEEEMLSLIDMKGETLKKLRNGTAKANASICMHIADRLLIPTHVLLDGRPISEDSPVITLWKELMQLPID